MDGIIVDKIIIRQNHNRQNHNVLFQPYSMIPYIKLMRNMGVPYKKPIQQIGMRSTIPWIGVCEKIWGIWVYHTRNQYNKYEWGVPSLGSGCMRNYKDHGCTIQETNTKNRYEESHPLDRAVWEITRITGVPYNKPIQ